jgi:NTE family protein
MQKRVGLALGGGAARGAAHIGVIQVLEREGIAVDCVAGTSVGSAVGAAYAAGLGGDRLLDIALHLRWWHIARPVWPRYGDLSFAPLERYLVRTLGDLTFADLRLPFACVAWDLDKCEPAVLRQGRLALAVRASCSVPGVVVPVEIDGRLLADGGVVNNLPISVVRELGAEAVIAVSLHAPLGRRPRNRREILEITFDTLITRAGDDAASADVHIPVRLTGFESLVRLSRLRQMAQAGRDAAEQALPAIRAVLGGE